MNLDGLPEDVAYGTMTCCRKCGRIAIFGRYRTPPNDPGDDDGQQRLEMDRWTCGGCGEHNESPVREKTKEGR